MGYNKSQGSRIHAIALPSRFGAIIKNMANMAAATAMDIFSY
jgi:hypothetical protein